MSKRSASPEIVRWHTSKGGESKFGKVDSSLLPTIVTKTFETTTSTSDRDDDDVVDNNDDERTNVSSVTFRDSTSNKDLAPDFEQEEDEKAEVETKIFQELKRYLLPLPIADLDLSTKVSIGKGAFGQVYRVRDHLTGKLMVLKRIRASDSQELLKVLREAYVLEQLQPVCRPHILCSQGPLYEYQGDYWLLSEYLNDYQTLADRIKQNDKKDREYLQLLGTNAANLPSPSSVSSAEKKKLLKEQEVRTEKKLQVCNMLIKGLMNIHGKNIAHRDIKPENIMVTRDEANVKFIDFGESCINPLVSQFWSSLDSKSLSSSSLSSSSSAPLASASSVSMVPSVSSSSSKSSSSSSAVSSRSSSAETIKGGIKVTPGVTNVDSCLSQRAVGSVLYMAPEILAFGPDQIIIHNVPAEKEASVSWRLDPKTGKPIADVVGLNFWQKADLWSLGLTCLEYLLGTPLFLELILDIDTLRYSNARQLQQFSTLLNWTKQGIPSTTWKKIDKSTSISAKTKKYIANSIIPLLAFNPANRKMV